MQELLNRIESFDIDGGPCASTFAMRLAKEQGWSAEFAERVIAEYKRFLFLGVTQGPVTPSEAIDEAWHLHMIYTESYWTRLCGEVFGKPFHHHPSKGGAAEDTKHRNQFGETRRKYVEAFGDEPPADIWGPLPAKAPITTIDTNTHWIVERKAANRWFLTAGGLVTAGVVAAGCMEEGVSTGVGVVVCLSPIVIIAIVGTMIGRAMQNRNRMGGGMGHGDSGGHSPIDRIVDNSGYHPGNHTSGYHLGHHSSGHDSTSNDSHAGHDTSAGVGHHGDAHSSSDSSSSDSGSSDSGGSSCGSSCGGGSGGD